ncbi:MAG: hypothetical protein II258_07350, partial [Spirochaetales bacterium]|nr:hypothetical protein [Spirochaetales bacterium]
LIKKSNFSILDKKTVNGKTSQPKVNNHKAISDIQTYEKERLFFYFNIFIYSIFYFQQATI